MTDVSVVIPTFRRPALLREAIASALQDPDLKIEVLVLDDSPEGSAADTVRAIADPRVHYFKCDPPSGGKPAQVRNLGVQRAEGRFIHFLDDDDRVGEGFYRTAVAEFERNPQVGVVFGNITPFGNADAGAMDHERRFFADASRRARLAGRLGWRRWIVANLLFKQTLLVNSACMIRREHVGALGGYDVQLGLNEDVDFYCRAIRRFGFRFVDMTAVHYRIQSDSLMHGRTDNQRLIDAYQRMYALYRARHGFAELLAMKLFARTVLRLV
jgi:glycosyltransferase involved in cell wall biosynthesis